MKGQKYSENSPIFVFRDTRVLDLFLLERTNLFLYLNYFHFTSCFNFFHNIVGPGRVRTPNLTSRVGCTVLDLSSESEWSLQRGKWVRVVETVPTPVHVQDVVTWTLDP